MVHSLGISKDLLNVDRYEVRRVLRYWVGLRGNGTSEISEKIINNRAVDNGVTSPQKLQQTSITRFLLTFECTASKYLKRLGLSAKCVDIIHNKIRKYNRKLFMAKLRAGGKKGLYKRTEEILALAVQVQICNFNLFRIL